ncbi:hypothetical protein XG19_004189 [Salmonella enterica subsp. enterica serovar Gaminara]|nr:hypothetical protein [Salmonella enterica subsp. enterica serovar Gaminara]ECF2939094.1 hypothetical protein [Salmonella enterica subsp. enterica serovar Reading]ECO0313601.1 hypothetical protein [Salmonella enterica subsp. enterica serovar Schwarzengrund]EDP8790013.1 hypothetical protein [Salmonella enterica subsp. enterica]ECY4705440.1 hypothetical protein [Salmonella enterica subsp. enterica serovar Gaminara]
MKLNKLAMILIAAGALPCLSAHAKPVEATATLNVTATTEITHQLTAVSGVNEGKVAVNTVFAKGIISATNAPLKKVSLAWVRVINPKVDGKGADFAKIAKEGGAASDVAIVQLKPVTGISRTETPSGTDKNVYTLSDAVATNFQYNVVSADANNVLKGGSYKMTVLADVVNV